MSEQLEQHEPFLQPPKKSGLRDAIRRVRLVNTEQGDGLADLREAERARLELLADGLTDVFAEVPDELDFFAFGLSNGEKPRLWIDMTCHVAMGRDRRTYMLMKDSRLGRTVLHEAADRDEMVAHVTDYVAERVLDRQRAIEGDWIDLKSKAIGERIQFTSYEASIANAAALLKQPEPQDAANEDLPEDEQQRVVRLRKADAVSPHQAPEPVWLIFLLGLVLGAGALAGWVLVNGRLI